MVQKKNNPMVYKYYDYLKENHLGKEKGISRDELANLFHIDLQTQKKYLRAINNSDALPRLVSTCGAIYMCNTQEECETAFYNEIKSGLSRLLKGKKMASKVDKNGQFKMQLGKYYKEIVEVFGDKYGRV